MRKQECLPEYLHEDVMNAQVDEHRASEDEVMPIVNGESGELLKAVPIPYNIRLARKRFLRAISKGLDIQVGRCETSQHLVSHVDLYSSAKGSRVYHPMASSQKYLSKTAHQKAATFSLARKVPILQRESSFWAQKKVLQLIFPS